MKKIVLLAFFAAIVSVIVYSYPGGAALDAGRDGTNAEGNQGGCSSCHNSGTTDATKVELDSAGVAVTSYHPGVAYTVKISASNGSNSTLTYFGFQLAAVLASGAGTSSATNAGTWGTTLPSGVQNTPPASSGLHINIIEQDQAITHTSGSGGNGSTYLESIPWTAPAEGTGSVVLYGIVNELSSQSNSKYEAATSVTITEATAPPVVASVSIVQTAGSSTICAGTSVTFTATPTNGGTAPTYQWKVNGTAVNGATASTYTTTTLAAGTDAVTCVMTSNLSGVTGSPATSNSVSITVNAPVTPSVSITTGNQTICSGTNATFTATPTNGGTVPDYQWKKNNVAINGATGSTYSSSALVNGDVITVVMTSNASCVTTTTATSNGITVTVTSPVTPVVSISSNVGNSICSGQSVTLTATPTNGGTTPTYQWYKNGSVITGATSSTYTTTTIANNEAIYAVLTSNATCASPTTATSDTITFVTVTNATPAVSIASSAGTSICAGASVTFTATPVNGGSAPTYQWKKNGTVITGATSSTYNTDTLANNDAITVVMTSNSACVSTTQATSNIITISIVANVTPAVSIVSGSGNSACSGVNVTFTATPTNGGITPTYQWLNNGSTILGANSGTYTTAGLANGDIISVSMTSSSSCASPSTATSNTITMSIITGAAASVSVSSSDGNIICIGQTPTFTANPVNGGSAPTYQWILNGSNVSGSTSSTYTPTSLSNGDIISVQITSNEQCITQSTVTSVADTLVVSSGGAPTVTVSSNQGDSICQGTTVTFTAATTLGGSSPTYQWMKNGNNVGTNVSTYIDNALATGDAITCSITSSLSCASPTTATSNALRITVNTPPVVNISISNDTLTSSSATSYQWYQNNIIIGNATGQIYVPAITGDYSVVVTDAQGCQNSTSVNYVTGISDVSAFSNLKVYPNPADGTLFIDLSGASTTGNVSLRLYDLSGQLLLNDENALLNPDFAVGFKF